MSLVRTLVVLSLVSSLAGCGSSPPRTASADPRVDPGSGPPVASDIAGAQPLEGPFASFDEVCGAPEGAPAEDGSQRHARCTVRVFELAGGGPFEAMATYFEGTSFDGNASLGLKTARGWFVQEIPDGRPFGGGLSHHTPSSAAFDPATTRFEEGVLRVVLRGSSASFVPGHGNLGSSRREWTSVQRCGLREDVAVCSALEEAWSRQCQVSDRPVAEPSDEPGPDAVRTFGNGESTCQERGSDVR